MLIQYPLKVGKSHNMKIGNIILKCGILE